MKKAGLAEGLGKQMQTVIQNGILRSFSEVWVTVPDSQLHIWLGPSYGSRQ